MAEPLFCDRCTRTLTSGRGEYYVIRIEAIADPTFSGEDQDAAETSGQLSALFEELKGLSEQEAMDQVFRRVVLHLCTPCYNRWIENPTGD